MKRGWKKEEACYHSTRNTMIPCQRPVPMSEKLPRVPLKVPKLAGLVAL